MVARPGNSTTQAAAWLAAFPAVSPTQPGIRIAPAIIARPQHWLHRGTFLVDWHDVAVVDDGRVTLREGAEHRDPMLPEAPRAR